MRAQSDNPYDPRVVLLEVTTNEPVGWVPAYLLDEVHTHREEATPLHVTVEQGHGPDARWHLRLLCRLLIG